MSESDKRRYNKALHAVQSGVKVLLDKGADFASPKHLRVGLNSAFVNDAAMARLLISKGVFTEDEYVRAIADEMEREQAAITKEVNQAYGSDGRITLG
jgi:hypothetical protein